MSGGTTLTKILITGGTGSLGSQLTQFYVNRGADVTVFSRDPHKQIALKEKVPNARYVLGDICDFGGLRDVIEGQDVVVHTAALKHIGLGESNVAEFIRINVIGSLNVANACLDADIEKSLLISSDKAVLPVNLYGKSKSVAEDIFISFGYSCLRYGNVVDSRNSFLDVWKRALLAGEKIAVRFPEPTRFFLTIDDAIKLVDSALANADLSDVAGGIFVPANLRSFSLLDVVRYLGIDNKFIKEESLLPGEKQHEILVSEHEQGKQLNNILSIVWKGFNGLLDKSLYCSKTSPRVDPTEFEQFLRLKFYGTKLHS